MNSVRHAAMSTVALAMLVATSGRLAAQTPNDTTATQATLKSDLRKLINAQEAFFARNETYAQHMGALEFKASPDVLIVIIDAKGLGWNAVAVSTKIPGLRCTIWVGAPHAVAVPLNDGAGEGVPTCKGP